MSHEERNHDCKSGGIQGDAANQLRLSLDGVRRAKYARNAGTHLQHEDAVQLGAHPAVRARCTTIFFVIDGDA